MDLEKTYDNICREELGRALHIYGVNSYLIRSMSSLYDGSRACVRLGSRVGERFLDRVVREVNKKTTGKGVKLSGGNGGSRVLNKYFMQMIQCWQPKEEHLKNSGNEYERVCNRMGLKINGGKSKVLVVKKE